MKRMFNMKTARVVMFALALSMLFSVVALAADPAAWYGNGSATQYYIGTGEELAYLASLVNTNTDLFDGKTITLTTDVDIADIESELQKYTMSSFHTGVVTPYDGKGWMPISPFYGTFDGNGYVIKNLYINRPDSNYQGLFGITYNGVIKNLGVIDVNVTGNIEVGGIAGRSVGLIEKCFTTGNVTGSYDGIESGGHYSGEYVGGISGSVANGGIRNSYSTADVTGRTISGGIGGSFLSTLQDVTISEYLYSTGTITTLFPRPANSTGGMSGGIFSHVKYANNTIQNSVALNAAQVSGNTLNMSIHKRIAYEELSNAATIDFINNYAWDGMVFKNLAGEILSTLPGGTVDSEDGANVSADDIYNGTVWGAEYANFPTDTWIIQAGKLPILKVFEAKNAERGGVSVQSGAVPDYVVEQVDPAILTGLGVYYNDGAVAVKNANRLAVATLWFSADGGTPVFAGANNFAVLDTAVDGGLNRVTVGYLVAGGNGFTGANGVILNITGATGVELVKARFSGYDEKGNAGDISYSVVKDDGSGNSGGGGIVPPVIPPVVPVNYDLNHDGVVDQLDLAIALRYFMTAETADFNKDGVVDIEDFILMLNHMVW